MEKIYNERCGFQVNVEIAYKESKGDRHKEDDERKIAKQVAEISARAMSGSAAEEVQAKEDGNSRKDNEVPRRRTKEGAPLEEKKGSMLRQKDDMNQRGFRKKEFDKGDFKRPTKRSDNPDVLYGRDFDEATMNIEDIIGEMGQVVIRGKIIRMDKREIKNEKWKVKKPGNAVPRTTLPFFFQVAPTCFRGFPPVPHSFFTFHF